MALECKRNKTSLHGYATSQMHSLRQPALGYKRFILATRPEDEPQIPSPALFDFSPHPVSEDGAVVADEVMLPLVAACATHLELLECFYVLRQRVLMSTAIDASFDIVPERKIKANTRTGKTRTLKDATLLEKRQVKWTRFVEFAALRFLHWMGMLQRHEDSMTITRDGGIVNDGCGRGSLLLRHLPPLDVMMVWHSFMLNPRFYKERCQLHVLYRLRMPWRAIHDAIDNRAWSLDIGDEASAAFEHLSVDAAAGGGLPASLFQQFEMSGGDDAGSSPATEQQLKKTHPRATFLNAKAAAAATKAKTTRLDGAYDKLAAAAADHHHHQPQLQPAEAHVQLATQLKDAVMRQSAFVDKMNARMWIRSPALAGTLSRAQSRYHNFLTLMRQNPRQTIVPTLDIDLVWHTHQCAPRSYARDMLTLVGRFVNHDDTISKEKLGSGFEQSRALWRVHFAQEYRVCGCWDCEALLSAVEAQAAAEEDMGTVAARIMDDVEYHRAVEVAIRGKKPLPRRKQVH